MARPKPKFAWIEDPKKRKTPCQQRMKGLRKTAEELTILCDTSACLVFFSRDDNKLMVWLTREEAKSLVEDYYALPENQRNNKTEKVIEEFELDHLIFQLENGKLLIALSETEIENLTSYVYKKIYGNVLVCPRLYLMEKWFLKTCEGESSKSGGVDDDDV